jgi:hypothetical protein
MDLKRTAAGDLAIENNDLALVGGLEETAQRHRNRLALFRGEWFLNPLAGVPYREIVWDRQVSVAVKTTLFRRILASDPATASIRKLSLTPGRDRVAILEFVLTTKEGQTLHSSDFTPFVVGSAL